MVEKPWFLQKVIASCLLITFSIVNVNVDRAYGNSLSSQVVVVDDHRVPHNLFKLQVPKELGRIEDSFKGTSDYAIILIQDAHAIPEAQRNIHKLIEFFQEKVGISLVALEGASGALDATFLKSFPDQELLRETLEM
jgi:hypothetical protein